MDEKNMPSMTTLDQIVSDDGMQALKAAIPYAAPKSQQFLSIFVKFLELQKTMHLFTNARGTMRMASVNDTPVSPLEMLQDIRQYTNGSVRNNIDGILNAFQMIQMFQMYQEMEEEQL